MHAPNKQDQRDLAEAKTRIEELEKERDQLKTQLTTLGKMLRKTSHTLNAIKTVIEISGGL